MSRTEITIDHQNVAGRIFAHNLTQAEFNDLIFSVRQYETALLLHKNNKTLIHEREGILAEKILGFIDRDENFFTQEAIRRILSNLVQPYDLFPNRDEIRDGQTYELFLHQTLDRRTAYISKKYNEYFGTTFVYTGEDSLASHLRYYWRDSNKFELYTGIGLILTTMLCKKEVANLNFKGLYYLFIAYGVGLSVDGVRHSVIDAFRLFQKPKQSTKKSWEDCIVYTLGEVDLSSIDARISVTHVFDRTNDQPVGFFEIHTALPNDSNAINEIKDKLFSHPKILQANMPGLDILSTTTDVGRRILYRNGIVTHLIGTPSEAQIAAARSAGL